MAVWNYAQSWKGVVYDAATMSPQDYASALFNEAWPANLFSDLHVYDADVNSPGGALVVADPGHNFAFIVNDGDAIIFRLDTFEVRRMAAGDPDYIS